MSDESDWMHVVKGHVADAPPEIELRQLLPGDRLRVVTLNTTYDFLIIEGRKAELTTERADRPSGLVRINGCTFGLSSTIKPDALFSGGNLEFVFDDGRMTHTTTAIRELHWLRTADKAAHS
jgi:hypothetical protein